MAQRHAGLGRASSQGYVMRKSVLFSLLAVGVFHAASSAQSENAAAPRRLPLTAFAAGLNQPPVDEEEQPAQDPRAPDQPLEMQHDEPHAPRQAPFPATMPSVIADRSVGIGILIVGGAGWILLAIAFVIFVSRQPPRPRHDSRSI
jgi:hypothetical protein